MSDNTADIKEKKAPAPKIEIDPRNTRIMIGVIAFSVIEAVAAFLLVFRPLFINPIYHNATLDEQGYKYSVKLFGNAFLSQAEKSSGVIYFPLSTALVNILLIYLVITILPIFFALFFRKGYAFSKTGLTAIFGLKAAVGLMPLLIPFSLARNSMRIFGAADCALCLAACCYFVYLSSLEYAEDMLFDEGERKAMSVRGKFSAVMALLMIAFVVIEKYAMPGYGINWSSILGGEKTKEILQGYVLVLLLAASLLMAVVYVRDNQTSLYFFAGFGCAGALVNVYALINKAIWVKKTYKPQKALANQGDAAAIEWVGANGMGATWWKRTAFIGICLLIAAVVFVMAFMKIRKRIFAKDAEDEKRPALITKICSLALVLCFILSILAVLRWDKKLYGTLTIGAMDYMYLLVYGGLTMFLALAMLGGISFSKWGALVLYILVGASNFSTIFKVFSARKTFVAKNPGLHGYDYIITAILFIVSLLCCLTIILMFVFKEIENYMYNKRNT